MVIKSVDLKDMEKELKATVLPAVRPESEQTAVSVHNPEYFKPTVKQRKLKSAFHNACKRRPTDPNEITVEFVRKYIISRDLENWWGLPGFIGWFRREEIISDRLAHLYQLRIDAIEEVLSDESNVYTARDKISAGEQLDKIAKTMVDAADAMNSAHKDMRSMEDKVAEALAKAKAKTKVATPEVIEKQPESNTVHTGVVFPDIDDSHWSNRSKS